MTRRLRSADEAADAVIDIVGKDIVLGVPIGIGKATHVVDALFARAQADQSISLTIFSGLSLEAPRGRSDMEKRFLEPLVDRLYSAWPTPAYVDAIRRQELPTNVRVREFYLRAGAFLDNSLAQRNYSSINYSQVAAELRRLGVNVLAQLVSARSESPGQLSLSSNPEITLDLLPHLEARRREGKPAAMVGQVNRHLPYMTGDAELTEERFDVILDAEQYEFPLFSLPSRRVSAADYATAMHVASLVPDGGTLQIGIGSLSDAVAHCLRLRHESPDIFADVLDLLPGGSRSGRRASLPVESEPFEEGLFACTELLSDAMFSLFDAGLVKRQADAGDPAVIHAGFFIGSSRLYSGLHDLDETRRKLIRMTRISQVNTLFGDEHKKRRQRKSATFVNETMIVTLLGAAVSDTLQGGRVVGGVGGQFDFVSMAKDLEDAHSVLMCRARRVHKGVAQSNIRWSYEHATVPRHHRDVYVSEYGVAATRGRTDRQVIDAMIGIADSQFQDELAREAIRTGKLEANYAVTADAANNTPDALAAIFDRTTLREYFPPYPLGTEFTATEQELIEALQWLNTATAQPWANWRQLLSGILHGRAGEQSDGLARMGLDKPAGMKQRAMQRLLAYALDKANP
ncbi:MAG: acetyl-CoA hydrolase [Gammaproteobacteria bacterium]|nr:acetyl-CoA hydrolase [Gammaproteobacteria bacterium]